MTKTTTVQLVDFTIRLVCESLVMRPCLIAEFASPAINDSNRTSRFGRFGVQTAFITQLADGFAERLGVEVLAV